MNKCKSIIYCFRYLTETYDVFKYEKYRWNYKRKDDLTETYDVFKSNSQIFIFNTFFYLTETYDVFKFNIL